MTTDDIIQLRELCDQWAEDHLQCVGEYHPDFHAVSDERFAALVAAAEREACAKVCDERELPNLYGKRECAAAIRARGKS